MTGGRWSIQPEIVVNDCDDQSLMPGSDWRGVSMQSSQGKTFRNATGQTGLFVLRVARGQTEDNHNEPFMKT